MLLLIKTTRERNYEGGSIATERSNRGYLYRTYRLKRNKKKNLLCPIEKKKT